MRRTYRATVRGRFEELGEAQRQALRAAQSAHGMFAARFTAEGVFLYGPELVGYQFRYEIAVDEESPADAELMAGMRAEEQAARDLGERGLRGRIVQVSTVSVDDMKVRTGARR